MSRPTSSFPNPPPASRPQSSQRRGAPTPPGPLTIRAPGHHPRRRSCLADENCGVEQLRNSPCGARKRKPMAESGATLGKTARRMRAALSCSGRRVAQERLASGGCPPRLPRAAPRTGHGVSQSLPCSTLRRMTGVPSQNSVRRTRHRPRDRMAPEGWGAPTPPSGLATRLLAQDPDDDRAWPTRQRAVAAVLAPNCLLRCILRQAPPRN